MWLATVTRGSEHPSLPGMRGHRRLSKKYEGDPSPVRTWCVQYKDMVCAVYGHGVYKDMVCAVYGHGVCSVRTWCVQYKDMVCAVKGHGVCSIRTWCVQYKDMVCAV